MGSAIIAASRTFYKNITEASKNMVKIEKEFYPDVYEAISYEEIYIKFKNELNSRGYI